MWWRSDTLALAVDPTLKGDDTTAIVISVVYRSCAIPVAWRIRRANQPGSWMDPIVELLQALAPAVPREMTVIVLCDRGLASPKAAGVCWRGPSFPVPIPLGSAAEPPSAAPPPNAAAPCWRSGMWNRRSRGSS